MKYPDPATELEVIRLTDPKHTCGLTAPHLRQFGRRSDFLLYWSDRSGTRQIYHMDLKGGESHQLTQVANLDPTTLSLAPDERSFTFFNGGALCDVDARSISLKEIYRVPEGAKRTGFTQATDGSLFVVSTQAGRTTVARLVKQKTLPSLSIDGEADQLMARPRHTQLLYRVGGNYWLIGTDGTSPKQLKLQAGQTGQVAWSPSGQTLLYLHIPEDPKQLVTLREYWPDEDQDREVARTSQFGAFGSNPDASVFAGASRSVASAYVVILLRVTRRELTVCEHRASTPSMVSPVFSPDSQSVFFVSDRHGNPAVYRVRVDKFVETTDG